MENLRGACTKRFAAGAWRTRAYNVSPSASERPLTCTQLIEEGSHDRGDAGATAFRRRRRRAETGAEAVQRGRQVAQDAASAASESTSQQGQQLTDTLQENVVKQPAPRHSG